MTKETETYIEDKNMVTRDREEEIVETHELAPEPAPEPEDIEDVIATVDDPRSEIYSRFSKKRNEEIEQQVDPEMPVDQEASGDIIESAEDSDQSSTPPDGDAETVEIRVYENTMNVPRDRIEKMPGDTFEQKMQAYQKQEAVNVGMTRNAQERQDLETRRANLDARERALAEREAALPATDGQQGQQTPSDLPEPDGQTLEEMARQYQEAVYDDRADAPQLLAAIVKKAAQTGQQVPVQAIDEDALRESVTQDVLASQRQAKIVKASNQLIAAHPELNQRNPEFDPRMFQAIDAETVAVEQEHPEWEPEQVVQEAYDRIQKWKGVQQTSETMSDKQAQKRAMTRPRSGTQRFTQPPPPPRKTNSDYVTEQRKARGLE